MWAECCVPLQAVDPANLRLQTNRNGKTPYGKLKYMDSSLQLDPFTIVTPSFPVLKYDTVKGRLDLDLAADIPSLKKFQCIQESLYKLLGQQQYEWFHSHGMSTDEIKFLFQPFVQGTVLSIFLSTLLRTGKPIWVYHQNKWSSTIHPSMFQCGKSVRLVLRLIGVQSFQTLTSLKCHIVMHPVAILVRQ
jgi:hypothetical protein